MDTDDSSEDQIEINISNINSNNKVVLNDQTLLDLILLYPFLYNRRVRPYQDKDYESWAWKNITAAFNASYRKELSVTFRAFELKQRWEILSPIVLSLIKAQDAIPDSLRRTVLQINAHLDEYNTQNIRNREYTKVESLILEHIPLAKSLSPERLYQLDEEVMNLILTTELDERAAHILSPTQLVRIEKQHSDYMKKLGINDCFPPQKPVEATQTATKPTTSKEESDSNWTGSILTLESDDNSSNSDHTQQADAKVKDGCNPIPTHDLTLDDVDDEEALEPQHDSKPSIIQLESTSLLETPNIRNDQIFNKPNVANTSDILTTRCSTDRNSPETVCKEPLPVIEPEQQPAQQSIKSALRKLRVTTDTPPTVKQSKDIRNIAEEQEAEAATLETSCVPPTSAQHIRIRKVRVLIKRLKKPAQKTPLLTRRVMKRNRKRKVYF